MQPTQPLQKSLRRLALTTKQAGKDYYKGTRSGSMGSHTKHGGYIIDPKKVRTFVVPDLKGFKLTPFVTKNVEVPPKLTSEDEPPTSGRMYLARWRSSGGGL